MKESKYFDLLTGLFVGVLVISNIAAVKLIDAKGIITDGGAILFPFVYIFSDLITEVYGYARMRRLIWIGFLVNAMATITLYLVVLAPPASDWGNQGAIESILGFVPRIFLASICGYLVGQFVNSYIMSKMKVKDGAKKGIYKRMVASTFVGEFFDTLVFCTIAFYGVITGATFLNYLFFGWVIKTSVEMIIAPFTYQLIKYVKREENIDIVDKKINYNPFNIT